jgi:hypothetical protein
MVAVVPYFIVLEQIVRSFSPYPNVQEISNLLIGDWDKILIPQKRKEADNECKQEEREGDSIKADATRFHRSDLTMPGKHPEGEKGCEQHSIGKRPLKNRLRNLVKQVFKDEDKGSLVFDKNAYFLKEKDDHIHEDQTAQSEAEDLQVFAADISLNGPGVFKHLRTALSISFG